jgi:amidase
MAKSVADAALLLGVLEGAAPDPNDPATRTCQPPPNRDYAAFLRRDGLKGARIGVPRAFYYDRITVPGTTEPRGGLNDAQRKVMDEAVAVLRSQGATVVEAEIPSITASDPSNNLLLFPTCAGPDGARGKDANCSIVFKYGMKRDFNAWLTSLGDKAPVKDLTALRAWNIAHERAGAIKYGQAQLDISDEIDLERDKARYEADRAKDIRLSGPEGIDAALEAQKLDALLFPGGSGAAIAAKPGYPTVIVPFGLIPNAPTPSLPDGFNAKPSPYGVAFTGTACSEPRLIEIAYAFEQATKKRVPPPDLP